MPRSFRSFLLLSPGAFMVSHADIVRLKQAGGAIGWRPEAADCSSIQARISASLQ